MVNKKGALTVEQKRFHLFVRATDNLFQRIEFLCKISLMFRIYITQSTVHIIGYDISVTYRIPNMRFHPSRMHMSVVLSIVFFYQVNAFRHIKELHIRRILL